MMNRIPLKELELLVSAGIIPQDIADNIDGYYLAKKQSGPNTFIQILGILGALLTGSGILLIVAHNWDDISLSAKTFLSFLPLCLSQLACAYTLWKRKLNRGWLECSSLLLFFSIGACLSLISQIYQVNGSLPGFLLTWTLLALPLIYILSSNIVAMLCLATITWYAIDLGYSGSNSDIPFMYAVIIILFIPHYYRLFQNKPDSNFFILLNWLVAISISLTLGAFFKKGLDLFEWAFLLYCILFCIYYLIGRLPFFENRKIFANPFLIIGTLGIIVTLLTWSFGFIWEEYTVPGWQAIVGNLLFYDIGIGLIIVLLLIWKSGHLQTGKLFDPLGYTFAVLLSLLLIAHNNPNMAVFIVNAWTVYIAIFFIRKGALKNHLGILNFGLTILAALAVCRFFDDKISFVWRGIFFLTTGIAFFAANYLLFRKRKQLIKPAPHV